MEDQDYLIGMTLSALAGLFMMLSGYLVLKAMKNENKCIYFSAFLSSLIFSFVTLVWAANVSKSKFSNPNSTAMTGKAAAGVFLFLIWYPFEILCLLCCYKKHNLNETEDFRKV